MLSFDLLEPQRTIMTWKDQKPLRCLPFPMNLPITPGFLRQISDPTLMKHSLVYWNDQTDRNYIYIFDKATIYCFYCNCRPWTLFLKLKFQGGFRFAHLLGSWEASDLESLLWCGLLLCLWFPPNPRSSSVQRPSLILLVPLFQVLLTYIIL